MGCTRAACNSLNPWELVAPTTYDLVFLPLLAGLLTTDGWACLLGGLACLSLYVGICLKRSFEQHFNLYMPWLIPY